MVIATALILTMWNVGSTMMEAPLPEGPIGGAQALAGRPMEQSLEKGREDWTRLDLSQDSNREQSNTEQALDEEVSPWPQVKQRFRVDFLLSEYDRDQILRDSTFIELDESGLALGTSGPGDNIVADLDLCAPDEVPWQHFVETIGGDAERLPLGAVTGLWEDYRDQLVSAGNELFVTYQNCMLDYFAKELFVRYEKGARVSIPQEFRSCEGPINMSFAADRGGWKISVVFDSAAYPAMIDQIDNIMTIKRAFVQEVKDRL